MYLGDLTDKQARLIPDKLALSDERIGLTFKQFADRVNKLTRALKDNGIQKGDRIAIIHQNCVEYLETFFAVIKLGAMIVPINYRLVTREIEFILRDSDPKAVFVGNPYADQTTPLITQFPGVENWINIHGDLDGYTMYEQFLSDYSDRPLSTQVDDETVISIFYTSGTTGLPKGIMHTSRSLSASFVDGITLRLTADDVQIKLSPIFHMTIVTVLQSIFVGSRTHLIAHFPGADAFLKIIEEEGITWGTIPPAVSLRIAELDREQAKKYDFSKFRLLLNSASPLAGNKLRSALDILDCSVYNSAGMTESPIYSGLLIENHHNKTNEELACAGKEGITSWLKIIDKRGNELPPNQPGELIVKSDKQMKGYWRNPQLTTETIKDGWVHTGDICQIDKNGLLFFKDRIKDMIISGSENIYSKEVEDVLYMFPSIAEAAVAGVPDEKWGEVPMAFIVLKQGTNSSEAEIKEFCKQNLAKYKVPKYISFHDALPRTPIGKVLKVQLKAPYWQNKPRYVN